MEPCRSHPPGWTHSTPDSGLLFEMDGLDLRAPGLVPSGASKGHVTPQTFATAWAFQCCPVAVVSTKLQFSAVAQLCLTLCKPMDCSTPGLPVHHQLLKFTQTHAHRVSDAIQPAHPVSSPSPPTFNLSQPSGSFLVNQFFASGGQSIGVSASASVLPMNIQD